jgi:hypothetical protein
MHQAVLRGGGDRALHAADLVPQFELASTWSAVSARRPSGRSADANPIVYRDVAERLGAKPWAEPAPLPTITRDVEILQVHFVLRRDAG